MAFEDNRIDPTLSCGAPSNENNVNDVFVYDNNTGDIVRESVATDGTLENAGSQPHAALSGSGRFVVFASDATNLVPNDTNGAIDVFIRNRDVSNSGTFDTPGNVSTSIVSLTSAGAQSPDTSTFPSVDDSGRFVLFKGQDLDPAGDQGAWVRDLSLEHNPAAGGA